MPDIVVYTLERYSAVILSFQIQLKSEEIGNFIFPDYRETYERTKERFPGILYSEPVLAGVFPPQDPFPFVGMVAENICKYFDNAPVIIVFIIAMESPYTLPAARVSWSVQIQISTTVDCYPSGAGFVHANIL